MNKKFKTIIGAGLSCALVAGVVVLSGCASSSSTSSTSTASTSSASPSSASATTASTSSLSPASSAAFSQTADYKIDYGTSTLYTHDDMDAAVKEIMKEFATFKGATMKEIAYTDDETGKAELETANTTWKKAGDPTFTQAICFTSTFVAPSGKEAENTAWEPGKTYEGWTWYLARTDGGEWKLLSNGYN